MLLSSAGVKHGALYEIITSDPEEFPLPSFEFLHIKYAHQRALAGMCAVRCLKEIFNEKPPKPRGCYTGKPDSGRSINIFPGWSMLIQAALDAGIIDEKDAEQWTRLALEERYLDEVRTQRRQGNIFA
ncbi:hypothetical protein V8F20_009069 [Naviculisporaceae sp. PSN 640]